MPKENIILGKQLNEQLKELQKKVISLENRIISIDNAVTSTNDLLIRTDDSLPESSKRDSFNKLRVSSPFTLFDSKLLGDNRALFWDDQEVSGSGTGTSYSRDRASVTLSVSNLTAGKRVRQTFQRFNYQPGKALAHGEPVLTPKGWVNIEDINIGDKVFDGLGNITEVEGVYYQGLRQIYRITFDDGTYVDADGEHLWKTIIRQNSKKGEIEILSTNQMLERYGEEPPVFARWKIPKSPVLNFDKKDIIVDPYTLGCILGDGYLNDNYIQFTTEDEEIVEYLRVPNGITKYSNKKYQYGLKGLHSDVKEYNLNSKKSFDKFIPDSYKYNSYNVRLEILKGLMDTDGTVDKRDGCCEFNSSSKQLAEDVAFLVRSLGGLAKIKKRVSHYKIREDHKKRCYDSYRVRVISPINPFKLKRKAELWKPRTRISYNRYIHSIKPLDIKEATCIRVKSKDHTFITRNNIVTHNSQVLMMTFVAHPPEAGIIQEMGLNDGSNGIFLRLDGTTPSFVIKSSTSGSPVDTVITQSNWNLDKGYDIDFSKSQIFVFDFESLQVGSVRIGFVIGGLIRYCHFQKHSNILDVAYFSTPNLPIRYSIENDGTGGAASLECICNTVISEGGQDETGIVRAISTGTTAINASVAGTRYALLGIRLKTTHLDNIIQLVSITTLATTNDNYEWSLILNPNVAGTFTYNAVTNSAIEFAIGATANTVTNGTVLDAGFAAANSANSSLVKTLRYLGSNIAGTPDTIVLCVRSLTTNGNFHATLDYRETS